MVRAGNVSVARVRRDGRHLVVFAEVATRSTRIRGVRVFAEDQWT